MNIEDLEGRVEGVLFSNKLELFEHLVEKNTRVLVNGTLSKHSEGDCSILIDSMKGIDDLKIIDIDVDISMIEDHFRCFHAIRHFVSQEQNKGENVVVLNLKNGDELRKIALGPKHAIADTDFISNSIQGIVDKFSTKKLQKAA